jgi:two-component system cell cycle sensor histidine kinase/response regulator CckA
MGEQMLERLGYEVTARTDPLEALALFQSQPRMFDLVITDMTMPQMTGDKLTKEILRIRPDMPIILCTGFSGRSTRKMADDIGIRKYMEKPLNRHELSMAIREILAEKRKDA